MFRCPACRTRRKDWGLFQEHLQATGHRACNCGGYHYAHRPGSPFCIENHLAALHEADRHGAGDADLARCAAYITEKWPEAAPKVRELLKNWGIHEIV